MFAALSPVVALPRPPLLCWAAELCACTRTVHSSRYSLLLVYSAHLPGSSLGTDTRARLQKPGFHVTNWHSDLRMTPLDTNDFVTAWVPLRRMKVGAPARLVSGCSTLLPAQQLTCSYLGPGGQTTRA